MTAMFIVVEGLDGVGKTTVSKRLAAHLNAQWLTTPSADLREVRAIADTLYDPFAECSQLFYAASVLHAGHNIREYVAKGQSVVLDRYWFTTKAYAEAKGSKIDLAMVESLLPQADLTLFLSASLEVRKARLQQRGITAHDRTSIQPAFDKRLHKAYYRSFQTPLAGKLVEVDTGSLSAEQCFERVLVEVDSLFGQSLVGPSAPRKSGVYACPKRMRASAR